MSNGFQINFNVLKGWPNPAIQEKVAQEGTGVTILEGQGGYLDANDAWQLGLPNATVAGSYKANTPYVFRNNTGDSDAGHAFNPAQDYNQVNWGGIQGLALDQPLEFQTSRFGGIPSTAKAAVGAGSGAVIVVPTATVIQKGDQLFLDSDGNFKTAIDKDGNNIVTGVVIVGICTRAPHQGTGQNPPSLIDIKADGSRRNS